MLAVYDRVIPSGSVPTLIALGLLVTFAFTLQGAFDLVRSRMLTRIGMVLKESINPRTYDVAIRRAAEGDPRRTSAVRDLDQVQSFFGSVGPIAFFDLPWMPFYIFIAFLFHAYIGVAVAVGAVVLIILTAISNSLTKAPSNELNELMTKRETMIMTGQQNAETLHAMGMTYAMSGSWNRNCAEIVETMRRIADINNTIGTISRTFRIALQSIVLGIGAYLVIHQDATGGIMIASSILAARALAPVELAIANWKNAIGARQSWRRLVELLAANPPETESFMTPGPVKSVRVEHLTMSIPGTRRIVLRDVSFELPAGSSIGIVGSTGSGKSTLIRGIVGLWPALGGTVRLDGHELGRWTSTERGGFVGYLPQSVALFEGTIAENIARFDPNIDGKRVMQAARAAGVEALISQLPLGYDTRVGVNGSGLSGGQAQRIGLARALYRDPFLLVLDEPNSNLDADGEGALRQAIEAVKARGGVVIMATHRLNILSSLDYVIVLENGRVRVQGTRDKVMATLARTPPPPKEVVAPPAPKEIKASEATTPAEEAAS